MICLFLCFLQLTTETVPVKIDTLITGATIVTVDTQGRILKDGAIAIDKGVIVAIDATQSLLDRYRAGQVIDAANALVMPGLVNTHTHSSMTLFRGFSDDVPLKEWLEKYIWPAEAEFINAENVDLGSRLAMMEMIRSGTTTFNDLYFFVDTIARAVEDAGMRAVLAESLIDFPTPHKKTPEEGLTYIRQMLATWKGHPLVTMAVGAHAPYTCSPDLLKKARALASEFGAPMHIHLSETEAEVKDIMARYGATPTGHLQRLGVLYDGLIVAHAVHLSDEDRTLLAANKVGMAHNPESNMKLASGTMPVPLLLKISNKVGLATDGVASNNDLNMFEAMDFAAKLQKVTYGSQAVSAREMVYMATINGARVLGLDKITGSLEVGKQADLIIIPLNKPHLMPMYDPWSHLVYSVKGSDVDTVLVGGRILMRNRRLLTLDERGIMQSVAHVTSKIRNRFGM